MLNTTTCRWSQHFLQAAANKGHTAEFPVSMLRGLIDEPAAFGFDRELENLIIAVFGLEQQLAWYQFGGKADVTNLVAIRDEGMELRHPPMPDERAWADAVRRGGELFGAVLPVWRTPANLSNLAGTLRTAAVARKKAAGNLVQALEAHAEVLGLDLSATTGRLATARRAARLVEDLAGERDDVVLVQLAARADVGDIDDKAVGEVLAQAGNIGEALTRTHQWSLLQAIVPRARHDERARAILDRLRDVARHEQHGQDLVDALQAAVDASAALLAADPPVPRPTDPRPRRPWSGRPGQVPPGCRRPASPSIPTRPGCRPATAHPPCRAATARPRCRVRRAVARPEWGRCRSPRSAVRWLTRRPGTRSRPRSRPRSPPGGRSQSPGRRGDPRRRPRSRQFRKGGLVSAPIGVAQPDAVRRRVEAWLAKDDQADAIALAARPEWPAEPLLKIDGTAVRVVPCPTPLAARAALHDRADGERLVLLTELTDAELGDGLLAHLSGQRVRKIDPWDLVRQMFGGVADLDPTLVKVGAGSPTHSATTTRRTAGPPHPGRSSPATTPYAASPPNCSTCRGVKSMTVGWCSGAPTPSGSGGSPSSRRPSPTASRRTCRPSPATSRSRSWRPFGPVTAWT